MSDADVSVTDRDDKGRFLSGNIGGGRPRGARNKLANEFVQAIYNDFQQNGVNAISRLAQDRPDKYLRLIAQILPRELDIALHVNSNLFQEAKDFFQMYQLARDYIGAEPAKLIEAEADEP
jgi:hypothetical protein